jgi:nitroreductase
MDILELIKKRRTIRKYKAKPIPNKILNKILEAARWAPSAHNSQPWRIIILKDKRKKDCLIKKLYKNSNKFFTSVNILLRKSIDLMNSSPYLIFVYSSADLSRKMKILGRTYEAISRKSEAESVSAAIENMHLVATSLNIGMAWLVFPLLLEKTMNSYFSLSQELMAVLTLGYPDEKPKITKRKTLKEISKIL